MPDQPGAPHGIGAALGQRLLPACRLGRHGAVAEPEMVHEVGDDRLVVQVAHPAEVGVQVRHTGRRHREEAAADAFTALEQAHREGPDSTPSKLLQYGTVLGFRAEQPPGGVRPGHPGR